MSETVEIETKCLDDAELHKLQMKLEGLWVAQGIFNFHIEKQDFIDILEEFGVEDKEQQEELVEEYGYDY